MARGLPVQPGAYLFLDASKRVIYVGKAKSLRARVRTYFGRPTDLAAKVRRTVEATHDIDCIVTRSEMEALLLEYNLIKEHRPRYNVVYRDDKKYPYLKVTLNETFPRVFPTRRVENDGSRYFGPYTDVGAMRHTLRVSRSVFPLPTCTLRLTEGMSERGCLDYFLGRCVGPCRGDVDPEEYRNIVDEVLLFLNGKKDDVVADLEAAMSKASREMRFEDAAKLRDRLFSLRKTVAKQHVTLKSKGDLDALGVSRLGRRAIGVCIQVREGRVIGRDRIEIDCTPHELEGEIVRGLLLGFYEPRESVPREILVPTEPADGELIREWLTGKAGRKVVMKIARRGDQARLLEMAEHNADVALAGDREPGGAKGVRESLEAVRRALGLDELPGRIEGFDISTIQGTDTYASMVVFENGVPAKSEYRTFRIREAPRRDDPRSIAEAVRRRARRIGASGRGPGLILIDGGETQLAAALGALREEGVEDLPVVSLAKREELIHFPGRPEPLRLPPDSEALKLLQRVRDEAHRFALRAHRRRRGARLAESALDEVPGIGPARRRALIQRFGSVEGIRRAGLEELAVVPGIGRELALSLWTHLGGAEER
jgi:excinuclease ABC subunit C